MSTLTQRVDLTDLVRSPRAALCQQLEVARSCRPGSSDCDRAAASIQRGSSLHGRGARETCRASSPSPGGIGARDVVAPQHGLQRLGHQRRRFHRVGDQQRIAQSHLRKMLPARTSAVPHARHARSSRIRCLPSGESRRELCLREPHFPRCGSPRPVDALQSEKLLWRIGHHQDDLSYAALLRQHLCLSRIAQRKPATDWQNELAIAQVVCKFTYL